MDGGGGEVGSLLDARREETLALAVENSGFILLGRIRGAGSGVYGGEGFHCRIDSELRVAILKDKYFFKKYFSRYSPVESRF